MLFSAWRRPVHLLSNTTEPRAHKDSTNSCRLARPSFLFSFVNHSFMVTTKKHPSVSAELSHGATLNNLFCLCGRRCFRLRSWLSMSISELPPTPTIHGGGGQSEHIICANNLFPSVGKDPEGGEWEWWWKCVLPHLGGNKAAQLLSGGLSGSWT